MNTPWFWFWLITCTLILLQLNRIAGCLEAIRSKIDMWADVNDLSGNYGAMKEIERDRHIGSLMKPPPTTQK